MVTFVSFFLWLMTGGHPVEVAVDPGVASVGILLDGVESAVGGVGSRRAGGGCRVGRGRGCFNRRQVAQGE